MQTFYIKRGDTSSPIRALLEDDGGPVDLTATSIVFSARNSQRSMSGTALADPDQEANKGVVQYTFSGSDVLTAGDFLGEFEVTFGSGQVATFPKGPEPHIRVFIQQDDAGTALSEEQIDDVREICALAAYSEAQSLLSKLNDWQLVKVAKAVEEWRVIHRKHTRFRGKGVDSDKERYRQQIRDEMRVMLGLPPMTGQFLIPSGAQRNVPQW